MIFFSRIILLYVLLGTNLSCKNICDNQSSSRHSIRNDDFWGSQEYGHNLHCQGNCLVGPWPNAWIWMCSCRSTQNSLQSWYHWAPTRSVLHHADFGQKRFLPGYVCWEGQLSLSRMLYCCCPSYRMQPLDCSNSYRNSTSRLYKCCL